MKHLDENTLERFMLRREQLDSDLVATIENHLADCSACREVMEFLASVHKDLQFSIYKGHPRVDALVSSLFDTAQIIPLYPFNPAPPPEAFDNRYTTVLAAMTERDNRNRFQTLGSFASQSENALLRVTFDREANKLRLYLNSENPVRSAYGIVSVPELASDFVTDANGQLMLDASERLLHTDWRSVKPVVHLKAVEYHVAREELERSTENSPIVLSSSGNPDAKLWVGKSDKQLHIFADNKRFSRVLVENGTTKQLVELATGSGLCALDGGSEETVIRLYR